MVRAEPDERSDLDFLQHDNCNCRIGSRTGGCDPDPRLLSGRPPPAALLLVGNSLKPAKRLISSIAGRLVDPFWLCSALPCFWSGRRARRHRKKDGEEHRYWSAAENRRVGVAVSCGGMCCIWARSTPRRTWRGGEASRYSMSSARCHARWRCFPRITLIDCRPTSRSCGCAICEAVGWPNMPFVAIKSEEQQACRWRTGPARSWWLTARRR